METKKKILVVEDDKISRDLIEEILVAAGYEIVVANDGQEGIDKVLIEHPDLIICDVLMPIMDGFLFYKELKKDEISSQIPVIILTARGKMEDTFKSVGVDGFLSKPYSPEVLLKEVKRLITLIAHIDVPAQEPSSTPALPVEEKSEPAPKEEEDDALKQFMVAPEFRVKDAPEKKEEEMSLDSFDDFGNESKKRITITGKKIIIFGYDDSVLNSMSRQLEKEKCNTLIVKDIEQVVNHFDRIDPSVALLQIWIGQGSPILDVLGGLKEVIAKKIKEYNAKAMFQGDLTGYDIPHIILYKTPEEVSAFTNVSAEVADVESILERARSIIPIKYFGDYSQLTFLSKIKRVINE